MTLVARVRALSAAQMLRRLARPFTNGEAAPITAGKAVRFTADGTVMLSKSNGTADQARVDGIVLDASIAAAAIGRVVVLHGTEITGLAGLVVPGWVYLGLAGALSTTVPALPTHSWLTVVGRPSDDDSFLFYPRDPTDLNP